MPPIVFFHAPDDAAASSKTSRPTVPDDGELSDVCVSWSASLAIAPYLRQADVDDNGTGKGVIAAFALLREAASAIHL